MCARLFLTPSDEELASFLEMTDLPEIPPRYNIAPGQDVFVVRADRAGRRQAAFLRWGLVPRGAADPSIGHRLINARSETASRRSAFREVFRTRRCVVPASGFYEWRKTATGSQPYAIRPRHGLVGVAGLWDAWEGQGRRLETFTLLTTEPNADVRPIHDRMPVLLDRAQLAAWLDPARTRDEDVDALLQPYPPNALVIETVSTRVNHADVDDPRCLAPADPLPEQQRLF